MGKGRGLLGREGGFEVGGGDMGCRGGCEGVLGAPPTSDVHPPWLLQAQVFAADGAAAETPPSGTPQGEGTGIPHHLPVPLDAPPTSPSSLMSLPCP